MDGHVLLDCLNVELGVISDVNSGAYIYIYVYIKIRDAPNSGFRLFGRIRIVL